MVPAFDSKDSNVIDVGWVNKGFCTIREEIAVIELDAPDALYTRAQGVIKGQAAFEGVVLEHGADRCAF